LVSFAAIKNINLARGFPSRILEVGWLPELLNLDCCAIVATIQIKHFTSKMQDGAALNLAIFL
jgi:hypothetical protein